MIKTHYKSLINKKNLAGLSVSMLVASCVGGGSSGTSAATHTGNSVPLGGIYAGIHKPASEPMGGIYAGINKPASEPMGGVYAPIKPVGGSNNLSEILKNSQTSCSDTGCAPGVYLVKNADDLDRINQALQAQDQFTDQWTNNHYAILLAPGRYAMDNTFELGYYTQILGLGDKRGSVTVSPGVEVYNQGGFMKGAPTCTINDGNPLCLTLGGLNNFWRGIENFTIDYSDLNHPLRLAVSQASPIRNMHFISSNANNPVLMCDYDTTGNPPGCGYTSGGFMADSLVDNGLVLGSQQQWITRNSSLGATNQTQTATWNSVFVGDQFGTQPSSPPPADPVRQPNDNEWKNFPISNLSATPIIKEKPYLICSSDTCGNSIDKIKWQVKVPGLRTNAVGVDNSSNATILDVQTQFYILSPKSGSTDAHGVTTLNANQINTINSALSAGKNLLIAPGVYNLDGGTINVTNNGTVVLGLGLPSLVCTSGNTCMNISAQSGVSLSGVVFDAGYKLTPNLLQIGSSKNSNVSTDPITLHDIYFRVAETQLDKRVPGQVRQTTSAATIYTNNVIGDNLWIWRADHDKASTHNMTDPTKNLVNWDQDKAQYGLVVYGDNVSMYGLAVEHFQNYQTVWYGENGIVDFYQSEMPYDITSLNKWICNDPKTGKVMGTGCASYVVNSSVKTHTATGIGIYTYFPHEAIVAPSAILAPQTKNVNIKHIVGRWLNGNINSGYGNLVQNNILTTPECWGYGVNGTNKTSAMGVYNSLFNSQTCGL